MGVARKVRWLTSRSTLQGKVLLAFLSLVGVITVAGTIVRQGTADIEAAFEEAYHSSLPATEALRETRVQVTRVVAEAEGFLVTRDEREARNVHTAIRALWEACAAYRAAIPSRTAAGDPLADEMRAMGAGVRRAR